MKEKTITLDQAFFGEKLVELFPKVVEKAFNKFYEEQNASKK